MCCAFFLSTKRKREMWVFLNPIKDRKLSYKFYLKNFLAKFLRFGLGFEKTYKVNCTKFLHRKQELIPKCVCIPIWEAKISQKRPFNFSTEIGRFLSKKKSGEITEISDILSWLLTPG